MAGEDGERLLLIGKTCLCMREESAQRDFTMIIVFEK